MKDREIVELFWKRDESALAETECKYGSLCLRIASGLLSNGEDAKECINDALFQAWNLIPPQHPEKLGPWLGRIVRNLSISLWRKNHRQKRYQGLEQALCELEDSLPSPVYLEREIESALLGEVISKWLSTLSRENRVLFVRRYWYGFSLSDLAQEAGISSKKLAQKMYRLRLGLKSFLEKEGLPYESDG